MPRRKKWNPLWGMIGGALLTMLVAFLLVKLFAWLTS